MKEGHPTYPQPTIQEALCEIRFEELDSKVEGDFFTKMFDDVREEFPSIEPIHQHQVDIKLSSQGMTQSIRPSEQRFKCTSEDGIRLIQFSPKTFIVNFLDKYPGWDSFEEVIVNNWEKMVNHINPLTVCRVGLRYINKLPAISIDEKLGKYLKNSEFVPTALIESEEKGFMRLETIPQKGKVSVTSVGLNEKESSGTSRVYMFDIDCIHEGELSSSKNSIEEIVNELHGHVWDIFDASMSEDLEKYLKAK